MYSVKARRYYGVFIAFSLLVTLICIVVARQSCNTVRRYELDKNIALSKAIAGNFLLLEEQMHISLHNAAINVENYIINKGKTDKNSLIKLAKSMRISGVNWYDINGKLEATSSNGFDSLERREFFKTYTIFDEDRDFYRKIKKMDIYLEDAPLLINEDFRKSQPYLEVLRWNSNIGKFINANFWTKSLNKSVERSIDSYTELMGFKIYTPSGTVIMQHIKNGEAMPMTKSLEYNEQPQIIENKDMQYIYFSFGNKRDSRIASTMNITSEKNEYFYNCMFSFSNNFLHNEEIVIKVTCALLNVLLIILVAMIVYYVYRKKVREHNIVMRSRMVHHDVVNPMMVIDLTLDELMKHRNYDHSKMLLLKEQLNFAKEIIQDLDLFHSNKKNT